jgi:hypothetical protein
MELVIESILCSARTSFVLVVRSKSGVYLVLMLLRRFDLQVARFING